MPSSVQSIFQTALIQSHTYDSASKIRRAYQATEKKKRLQRKSASSGFRIPYFYRVFPKEKGEHIKIAKDRKRQREIEREYETLHVHQEMMRCAHFWKSDSGGDNSTAAGPEDGGNKSTALWFNCAGPKRLLLSLVCASVCVSLCSGLVSHS